MRDWLTFYKDENHKQHRRYSGHLKRVLHHFTDCNLGLLKQRVGGWDVATIVPSTDGALSHPMYSVVDGSGLGPFVPLLRRNPSVALDHRVYSDDAFVPESSCQGLRVLLIDDVFTTGARAQSAASSLEYLGGASVPAILTLARRINPEFCETTMKVWIRQRDREFHFGEALDWL